MSKRSQLAILLIVGLLLLLLGLWFFLRPLMGPTQVAQPPSLPSGVTPYAPSGPGTSPIGVVSSTIPLVPTPAPNAQLVTLENNARTNAERIGSGVSGDGFVEYEDVLADFTPQGQTQILAQQRAMQSQHPASGASYGITTRGISSHVTTGAMGDPTITVMVEAIQYIDNGNPTKPVQTLNKLITVTFEKQTNNSYLISDMVWSDEKL